METKEIEDSKNDKELEIVYSKGSNDPNPKEVAYDCSNVFTTDKVFKSRAHLVKWARDLGKENRFIVIIKSSDSGTLTKKPRITFGCERMGNYDTPKRVKGLPEEKRCRTGSKKCGCPFLLKGKKLENDDDWCVIVVCGVHNHSFMDFKEGHSYAGRLTGVEFEFVSHMSHLLIPPMAIFNALKLEHKGNTSNMKVIYNARQRLKIVEKVGRSNMQLLMSKVTENNYIEFHREYDETNAVKDLFLAHPFGIDLLRTFPRVLMMDCTYRTNRYSIPLLQVVGMTCTEITFSVAFSFIESEKEDNYTWALERLRTLMDDSELPQVIITDRELALMNAVAKVFPGARHMLCLWHIEKNIATNCKKIVKAKKMWDKFNSAWNMVVFASTVEDYQKHLATLNKDFVRFPNALKYLTFFLKKKVNLLSPYCFPFATLFKCLTEQPITTNNNPSPKQSNT